MFKKISEIEIKKVIFTNWQAKIISILLAGTLYWFVSSKQPDQRYFSVPINVENLSGELAIISEVPELQRVLLKGPKRLISVITEKQFYSWIDLTGAQIGIFTLKVNFNENIIPKGVELISLTPEELEVQLEPVVEKYVTVHPVLTGNLPEGFRYSEAVRVKPEELLVAGAASRILNIESISTKVIDISKYSKSIEVEREFEPEPFFRITDTNKIVKVTINIAEKISHRNLYNIPVLFENLNEDYKVKEPKIAVDIAYYGRYTVVESLSPNDIKPFIDLKDIKGRGKYSLKIEIRTKRTVKITGITPDIIEIEIIK